MASFTPSNLQIISMGSVKLTVATIEGNVLSGTDYWASGIDDIRSIVATPYGSEAAPTNTGFSITWTKTNGTIHIIKQVSASSSGYSMWIMSGGPDTYSN